MNTRTWLKCLALLPQCFTAPTRTPELGSFGTASSLPKYHLRPTALPSSTTHNILQWQTSDDSLAPITVNCLNSFQSSAPYKEISLIRTILLQHLRQPSSSNWVVDQFTVVIQDYYPPPTRTPPDPAIRKHNQSVSLYQFREPTPVQARNNRPAPTVNPDHPAVSP